MISELGWKYWLRTVTLCYTHILSGQTNDVSFLSVVTAQYIGHTVYCVI